MPVHYSAALMNISSTNFQSVIELALPENLSMTDAIKNVIEEIELLTAKEIAYVMLLNGLQRVELEKCLDLVDKEVNNPVTAIATTCTAIGHIVRRFLSEE